ncbi:hypothetical protein [Sphingobium cupriresistens]|uniref:Short-chain dehydrogenase n=1 Tax=Sphingobium cupriresistens LL01 TaxID=1420583 RepID=A0A0J8AEC1_9SPHN|nr:hypothetical protein [Sphingobium cupriresistens]KMS53365.1 hypothetical protein V473_19085 [Sphingobium cupriresistens LL01]
MRAAPSPGQRRLPGFIRTALSAPLIADAALFLAAPAGAFATGHNLVVDGGTLMSDGS